MSTASSPLEGTRVVSIAVNLPGPVATDRLRRLGAHATSVLPPGGDPLEAYVRPWYEDLHAGHELVTLNLKEEGDRERLDALLAGADVFITSHRPSALARLGLAPEAVAQRFPQLVQVPIVGHPGEGAEVPGHDLTYQAVNGILNAPAMPRTLVADLAGAERAASEAMAGLLERARTGAGSVREVALSDAAEYMAQPFTYGMTAPGAILGGGFPGYGIYATADDRHVALAALEPHFFERTRTALGIEGTAEDLERAFAARTAAEWEEWAREHDVPLCAIP